ncbi:MAG TPA: hypothetical protein VFJ97_01005 [Dermatophilaceae bacterium]|nr:hypothetical protein [Dermatophilaceae bacterium]
MALARSFWAWHRVGLPSPLAGRPPAGSARAAIPARVSVATAGAADVPIDLLGPGDVGGLDPEQVRRTEPVDGCTDFEPAMFPYVELRDADLPWRFTPEGPVAATVADPEHPGATAAQRRLQPWLALVVVPLDDAELAAPAGASTARLTCPGALLPDPTQAWAWAHVHLTERPGVPSETALLDPEWSFARVLCPVRLAPDRQYLACLVPTYAAGVAAAGLPPPAGDPLGPAWVDAGAVTLPVYHSWTFGTAGSGTFETLARRLRPRQAPAAAGGVTVRIDAAGWGAAAAAGSTVTVQGAVRPLSEQPDAAPDPGFASSLAAAVSADGPALQLRPPLYGQDHAAGATTVSAATGPAGWFEQLNTDARHRSAAGLAAWAVLVDQEDLVDRAWAQLAAAEPASVGVTSQEVAAAVTASIADRHLGGALGTGLGDGARLGVPASAIVARRLMRPGGPLARRGMAVAAVRGQAGLRALAGARPPATSVATGTAYGRFCPTFPDPAFELLRATSPAWVLPGLDGIPLDSVVLMRTNQPFVEAFLVGLDHALGRELRWRRFPLDASGTMFRTFWPTPGRTAGPSMQPVDDWDPASSLGSHLGDADRLVVVLRGSLIRRFPSTTVYLSGQQPGGPEEHVAASFEASIGPDTTLVGFPRTVDELATGPSGQVWYVVLQEAVQHPRFGVDEAPADGSSAPLTTWQDLDWAHPQLTGRLHVPVEGPLLGVGRPTAPTTPLGVPPVAVWGADSAAVAAALTRAPVRVRIPVSLWLRPADSPHPHH